MRNIHRSNNGWVKSTTIVCLLIVPAVYSYSLTIRRDRRCFLAGTTDIHRREDRFSINSRIVSSHHYHKQEQKQTHLFLKYKYDGDDDDDDDDNLDRLSSQDPWSIIAASPGRSAWFSILMAGSGAILGPFLDSYHSAFGVLQYESPITATLWGKSDAMPALITSWWVPPLFALAGFLIGWLYILLDNYFITGANSKQTIQSPSPPKILFGIAMFTFQYWLSGILFQQGVDRSTILNIMSLFAAGGFWFLDGTFSGLVTSTATAIGGPLIEMALITLTRNDQFFHGTGYQYTDLGETGFFPLWIIPVYFLGGPANGNLARGFWTTLTNVLKVGVGNTISDEKNDDSSSCAVCGDTRRVPCPNCDGVGTYVAMGGRNVICTSCRGRGFVVCRSCFSKYGEDPNDLEAIRELMSRFPD